MPALSNQRHLARLLILTPIAAACFTDSCPAAADVFSFDRDSKELVRIDVETGEVTTVGPAGVDVASVTDMAMLDDGRLWAVVDVASLGQFDTETGALTIVGNVLLDGEAAVVEGLVMSDTRNSPPCCLIWKCYQHPQREAHHRLYGTRRVLP